MGITPTEFYNCTYKDIREYVEYNSLQRESEIKQYIQIAEALGNKLAGVMPFVSKKPKNISLIKDVFSELFAEELKEKEEKENQPQSIDEMIANMRSWGSRNSKPKQ